MAILVWPALSGISEAHGQVCAPVCRQSCSGHNLVESVINNITILQEPSVLHPTLSQGYQAVFNGKDAVLHPVDQKQPRARLVKDPRIQQAEPLHRIGRILVDRLVPKLESQRIGKREWILRTPCGSAP